MKTKNTTQHLFFNDPEEIIIIHYYDQPIELRALFCENAYMQNDNGICTFNYKDNLVKIGVIIKYKENMDMIQLWKGKQKNINKCLDNFINGCEVTINDFIQKFEEKCPALCKEIFNDYLQKQLENKPKQRTMKI